MAEPIAWRILEKVKTTLEAASGVGNNDFDYVFSVENLEPSGQAGDMHMLMVVSADTIQDAPDAQPYGHHAWIMRVAVDIFLAEDTAGVAKQQDLLRLWMVATKALMADPKFVDGADTLALDTVPQSPSIWADSGRMIDVISCEYDVHFRTLDTDPSAL